MNNKKESGQSSQNRSEMLRSPERPENKITAITFVVPSLDEGENILKVRDTLHKQKEDLPGNISLRLVISDNGSDDVTQGVYRQITTGEELAQRDADKQFDVTVVRGSKKGFVGSARHEGIKDAVNVFHEKNPNASPDTHVIVNFDADTEFERGNALQRVTEIFANPATMVAYGPIKFKTSSGQISTDYQAFQRPFTRVLLRHLFRGNGKRRSDYINQPYEIFHSAFTAMRESVLVDSNDLANINIVRNYNPEDRTGDDVRISLLLQRHLSESAVIFDKDLAVLTSARIYETKEGGISRYKLLKNALNLFLGTRYVPYALQRELDLLPEEESAEIIKGLRFGDVVGSFAHEVDQEVYELGEGERLIYQSVKIGKAKRQERNNNIRVLPAKDLKTGEWIQNRFAVVRLPDN